MPMNNHFDYLKNLYETYSDDEVVRLYTSGDLTEEAEKVAINEIKARKLKVPNHDDSNSNTDLEHAENSMTASDMKVIANNLRFDEAIILSELMIAEGIPSDVGSTTLQNAFFPSGLSGVVRVPKKYISQAIPVIEAFNSDKLEGQESVVSKEEPTENIELSDEEKKILKELNRRFYFAMFIIISLGIFILVYGKPIIRFISPFITPNIFHGLLLVASYFMMKSSVSIHEKGGFDARNGTHVKKEDSPIGFWIEVAGGYIIAAICFTYGLQYFIGLSLLPTSQVEWDNLIQAIINNIKRV
jgi:hypothetical protein